MKKYPHATTKGNVGEALFESLIGPFATPHKIDASKDIGIDYLCEWKNKDKPTGIIFIAQVKYYTSKEAIFVARDQNLNLMNIYKITPTVSINRETQEYWSLFGLPCYLFVIIPRGNHADLFYKRYTPILHHKAIELRSPFYKANDQLRFLAYSNPQSKIGGFARDLYIDQMRSNYNKGLIGYLNPRNLGLAQFPDKDTDVYFRDIFQEYKLSFEDTFKQLELVFGENSEQQAIPSEAPPGSEDE